ncbi:MAG: hypothetical protein HOH38_14135, partial [Nitrospinaceae bacterium]|nr:hypothetical protein [Nitrospinaceae bacterium]
MESTDKPTPELEKTEDTLAPDLPSQTQEEPPKKFAQTSSQTDEEMLFSNRQNFLRFNRFKIDRNLITLSDIDRLIFLVIPRLLHVHQEGLPGYFEGDPPCGIYN